MKGVGQAEFQRRLGQHLALAFDRNVLDPTRRFLGRVIVGVKIPSRPLLQEFQLRVTQGSILTRRVGRGMLIASPYNQGQGTGE